MPLTADDRSEIIVLAGRYSQSLDLRDPDGWRSCFTDDAVMEMELQELWITGDALWSLASGVTDNGDDRVSRHQPSNFVIDGDGDEATMKSYCTVVSGGSRDNPFVEPARITFQGRYEDRLRRVDGAWKIAHRKIFTDWIDSDINAEVTAGQSASSVSEAAS
ncbi:MAG: nuclear transport factor 2 family protein [Chloroflexota bacterium]|nr:nuclear transport factor 2 family protein [Chloroflexota bacterium]MDE2896423.1 nuclear transport factor 2 family protein [Chloroflexota bacterium]